MPRLYHIVAFAVALCLMAVPAAYAQAPQKEYVTIGTAGITGIYYPTGGAICRLLSRGESWHGIRRCFVESTDGSIDNLIAVHQGKVDFGVVQSDWQYHAVKGDDVFQDLGPNEKLRSVFSLYSEPFTVMVRADSDIKAFDDLKGKRVNVGPQGSGNRATLEVVLKAKGWDDSVFAAAKEYKIPDQGEVLCTGQVDAIIISTGHPNGGVQKTALTCATRLIDVTGPAIDGLVKDSPYYTYATIPGGMYPGTPNDIHTFGMKATLVTSADMPEEYVYQLVKSVFENFDVFSTLHPVFSSLTKEGMLNGGLTAPMHPGALRYFREAGLMKDAP